MRRRSSSITRSHWKRCEQAKSLESCMSPASRQIFSRSSSRSRDSTSCRCRSRRICRITMFRPNLHRRTIPIFFSPAKPWTRSRCPKSWRSIIGSGNRSVLRRRPLRGIFLQAVRPVQTAAVPSQMERGQSSLSAARRDPVSGRRRIVGQPDCRRRTIWPGSSSTSGSKTVSAN
jgi:hypothetical protein